MSFGEEKIPKNNKITLQLLFLTALYFKQAVHLFMDLLYSNVLLKQKPNPANLCVITCIHQLKTNIT